MSSSLTPLAFTGISQFSSDFQTILSRAVSIASLPLQQLQNQQTDALQKKALAGGLGAAVNDLANAVSALGSLGQSQAMTGSCSDSSKVQINSTTATAPASYSISVTTLAAAAGAISASFADPAQTPVSATGQLKLTVGAASADITLDPGQNNLNGLRDAINASGLGVTASVLSAGTTNYLSVTANSLGEQPISLIDDPTGTNTSLLSSDNPGADAVFSVNGATFTQHDNMVSNVVPGVSFTLKGVTNSSGTDTPVTVMLSPNYSSVSNALKNLADKYNAVKQLTDAQTGSSGGLLTGDSAVIATKAAMRALVNYNGGDGAIQSLAALGIEMDKTGKMSFNSDTFNGLPSSALSSAFSFLGTSTTGFGELAQNLGSIGDPISGLLKVETDQYDAADARITQQMSDLAARINTMQVSLSSKLQMADSLVAQLTSQQNMLTASVQSLNYASYGKSPNS